MLGTGPDDVEGRSVAGVENVAGIVCILAGGEMNRAGLTDQDGGFVNDTVD